MTFITQIQARQVSDYLKQGHSEREIAKLVGVSRWAVIRIKRGRRKPRKDNQATAYAWAATKADRKFRSEVLRRRREFQRAWDDWEPWLMRLVMSWRDPQTEGCLASGCNSTGCAAS